MDPHRAVPGARQGSRARTCLHLHRRSAPQGEPAHGRRKPSTRGEPMTYQLAALRFRSIGERSARFTDITLNLTAPGDQGALPQDSVIWLRNGGGKSSILSLLYAQLLPHANDFMGRAVQRSLTDYVDSGDTSHVAAMWRPPAEAGAGACGAGNRPV